MISSNKDSDEDSDDIDSEENWLFAYKLVVMKTRPLSLTDSKFTKSFVSTMKRYRKEYIKYNLIKYVVPHAVLHKQKRMHKEVISHVLSYL